MAPSQYKYLINSTLWPENLPNVTSLECLSVVKIPSKGLEFNFSGIYAYLTNIKDCMAQKTVLDPRVEWYKEDWLLTEDAARAYTHEKWESWSKYPTSEILKRLVNWKLPLFQLITLFPRQPLDLIAEAFTTLHLMGDPIDTIASLLFTLHLTDLRVKELKKLARYPNGRRLEEKDCNAIALILATYDECSGTQASLALEPRYVL